MEEALQQQRSSEAGTRNPQSGTGIDTGAQLGTFQPSTGGDFLRTEDKTVTLKVVGNDSPVPAITQAKPFPSLLFALLVTVCVVSGFLAYRLLPRVLKRTEATEDLGEEAVEQVVRLEVEPAKEEVASEKPRPKKPKPPVRKKKNKKKKKR